MRYSISVDLPRPITAARAADVVDTLGDRYDSASIFPRRLEFDGSVRQLVHIGHILIDLRSALGWPSGLKFRVEHDPTDRLGNPA